MAMGFNMTDDRQDYSIGVGGVVVHEDKVLLINFALGANQGAWAIPGGFPKPSETINVAIQREVFEATGINTEVIGLIAVRSRVTSSENSAYFIFLLQAETDSAQPNGIEVLEARFFTPDDVEQLPGLGKFTRLLIAQVFQNEFRMLPQTVHPDFSPNEFILYM
jgi:ADP-ribose pyrophosphatase YjhB (NUDIX family)